MTSNPLPAGKLPPDLLAALLEALPPAPPEVVVGAKVGEDAAVVELEGRYLVFASDPVTLSAEPGVFAVQVNANDIAVMGAEPRWLLASILLPEGATSEVARQIMTELSRGCESIGVALIGGHTEVTPSVIRPVVAATMIGEAMLDRLVTSSGARPGDVLLLAGPIAVEGTAILARDFADTLRERGVSEDSIREGATLLGSPGISVLPAARTVQAAAVPHALHDPTEGGLLSAVREVAMASGTGALLEADRVPIFPATRAICGALGLDLLGLLASGSLLAAVVPEEVEPALSGLREAGIDAAQIGVLLPAEDGMIMVRDGKEEPLATPERDELARWIEENGGVSEE